MTPLTAWSTVAPVGEIDLANAAALLDVVLTASTDGSTSVIIDFHHVTFIDVVGLDALVHAQQQLRSTGHDLRLRSVPPTLRLMLDIFGLTDLLEQHPPRSPTKSAGPMTR